MILENQLRAGTALSQALSVTASSWLVSNDVEGLQELVTAQSRYPDLVFAILTDRYGQVKAHTDPSKIGQYLTDLPQNPKQTIISRENNLVDIVVPSLLAGKQVGWVRIGLSQKRVTEQLNSITNDAIIYGILSVMIGTFMVWLLGGYVTRRLYAIQNTINQVASGNPSARANITGNDETATIAREFNNMLDARQKADIELQKNRKSLEDYKFALDQSASIAITDKQGIIVSVNDNFCQQSKYSREELTGKTFQFIQSDYHTPFFFKDMWDTIQSGNVWSGEINNRNKEGEFYWIQSTIIPFLDNQKRPFQYLSICFDITEKKKSEEKLKQSEEMNRALIENISDGIVLVDSNWTLRYQSPSVERIVGYSIEDRKDKRAIDFIHPDDIHIFLEQYQKAKTNAGVPIQSQYRTMHKSGGYIWIEVSIINLLNIKSVQAYVVVYRNITERKQLEDQQLLISSIVNSSDDAIISKTFEGIITSWNYGAEKMLGYTAKEIVGRHISIIIPPDLIDEEQDILKKIKTGQSVYHYETQRLKNDGTTIFVSLTISPITDSMGNVIAASKILRDITASKLYEQKLNRASIKAQEDERYEIGSELHDNVCQILATSRIYLGLIKKLLPPTAKEYFIQANQYITQASEEIRNLSHRLAPAFFDGASLEDSFKQLLSTFNIDNKYEIILNVDEQTKHITNHELHLSLYRILQEQLGNILKHANAICIQIDLITKFDLLQMKIADNGVGFTPGKIKAGIGLANINRRVQLLSGRFSIQSIGGRGCEILVEIPLNENI